ncbi:hypothetical protein KSP39_PZI019172 [Platanthera zijinensis]|uniref:Uncharacterized protein n=1 Tax=Platanthera zijinensis TaxID=2320716 RepID=A0AAP0B267_9ASPA
MKRLTSMNLSVVTRGGRALVEVLFSGERAALAADSGPNRNIEKRKPIPDPQVYPSLLNYTIFSYNDSHSLLHQETGLKYGKKTETKKPQD